VILSREGLCGGVLALILSATSFVGAQELEPRAYRTLPVGLNFALVDYGYKTGNVVSEPASPIQDLSAEVHTISFAYLRSMDLFGRSASLTVIVPYIHMSAAGTFGGEAASGNRSGPADARARLAVNLIGGPALPPAEFAKYRQGRNLGVSLTISAPTGQYASDYLINFGTNRWAFKPEIGYSSIRGRWIFECAVGAWFFTTNNDFYGGVTREQDPIGSLQGHLSYNFSNGVWLALDANYFTGGRSTIDGNEEADLQKSSRVGLTLSLPLGGLHSLKLSTSTGAYTSFGADFDAANISYQFGW
jgi:hypothetical protein